VGVLNMYDVMFAHNVPENDMCLNDYLVHSLQAVCVLSVAGRVYTGVGDIK